MCVVGNDEGVERVQSSLAVDWHYFLTGQPHPTPRKAPQPTQAPSPTVDDDDIEEDANDVRSFPDPSRGGGVSIHSDHPLISHTHVSLTPGVCLCVCVLGLGKLVNGLHHHGFSADIDFSKTPKDTPFLYFADARDEVNNTHTPRSIHSRHSLIR